MTVIFSQTCNLTFACTYRCPYDVVYCVYIGFMLLTDLHCKGHLVVVHLLPTLHLHVVGAELHPTSHLNGVGA